MAKTLLEMKNIMKTFPDAKTLDNANLQVEEGEIHALVGENDAGKPILMNVLNGIYPYGSYGGHIIYDGEVCKFGRISDSEEKGIVIIHQELALVPYMSIVENMHLGNEKGRKYAINWNETYGEADEYLKIVGLLESSHTPIKDIGVGKQQLVEIAKVLAKHVELLILDEPTASLNEDDSRASLELLPEFKSEGMTSIIISHKLNEIAYVADKITAIRDGSTIETLDKRTDTVTEDRITKRMVGRELVDRFPKCTGVRVGKAAMEVWGWDVYHLLYSDRKAVDNIPFRVGKGEVVGTCGFMGAGRAELAMSIFGESHGTNISGRLLIHGTETRLYSVRDAIRHKLAYVTEDRKGNGPIFSSAIKTNTTLANMEAASRYTVIDKDKEYMVAEEHRDRLRTKCPSVEQNVGNLSGGSQQKVLPAKWTFTESDILILDEPIKGIDVGAKYEIYCIINQPAVGGKFAIMISSELPEVLGVSDRIYTMNEGRIAGGVKVEEVIQEHIMSCVLKSDKGEQSMENKIKLSEVLKKYTMAIVLAVVVILFIVNTGGKMLLPQNMNNLIAQNAYVFILAAGILFCILIGGNIDLSVDPVVCSVGATGGSMVISMGVSPYLTLLVMAMIGMAVGAWQGFWIAYARIPPFIVTLAGMLMFRGLSNVVLQGMTLSPILDPFLTLFNTYAPDISGMEGLNMTCILVGATISLIYAVSSLYGRTKKLQEEHRVGPPGGVIAKTVIINGMVLFFTFKLTQYKGIPNALVRVSVIIGVYSYISSKATTGRYFYAVGGNEKVTRLSGIDTNCVYSLAYLNMGLLAVVAGMVTAARLNSANPTAGNNYEMDAIGARFIGGASVYGGTGTVSGVIIGATLMGVLNLGTSIVGVDRNLQKVVKGAVLLAAVIFDVVSKRKSFIVKQ